MSQLSQEEAELLSQENRFLKQTIFNLRTELEKLVNDQDSLIQTKIVEFSKEQQSLKKIIEIQRQEADKVKVIADEEKQSASSKNIRKIDHLKEIIQVLRSEL